MLINRKIGFLGGGRMGEALIRGIVKAGLVPPNHIFAADPDAARRSLLEKEYGVTTSASNVTVVENAGIVILAVKPQLMGEILAPLRSAFQTRHLVISIAAGIPIAFIKEKLAGTNCRIIRVMPNTPALILAGAAALSPGRGVSDEDLQDARIIFDAIGISVVLDEAYLDAVTGLSGSGPAYVFTFIEALIDGGVRTGLPRDVASKLAIQTVIGSARLLDEMGRHPAELRAMVTSPGGTTIAGMHVLEKEGFRGAVMDAVVAATRRSEELGRPDGDRVASAKDGPGATGRGGK